MPTYTETLIQGGLIKNLKMEKAFYQGLFGNQFYSTQESIIFDEIYDDLRQVAKYVDPAAISVVNRYKGYEVKSFKPAYVKEKDAIEAWSQRLMQRMAGEDIGGSRSPEQRAKMIRAKQIQIHRQKIENRIEQMCAEALVTGAIRISGDQYEDVTVNFGRDAALTILTPQGGAWVAAGTVDPLVGIGAARDLVYDKGNAVVDTLIMGRAAYAAFLAYMSKPERKALLQTNVRGSDLELNLLNAGGIRGVTRTAIFTGLDGAQIEVYVDSRKYITPEGAAVSYVGDKQVVGFDSNVLQGVQAFGIIADKKAGYKAQRIFHKEFENEEPSIDYLLSQSAPLPIVLNPNSTFVMNAIA